MEKFEVGVRVWMREPYGKPQTFRGVIVGFGKPIEQYSPADLPSDITDEDVWPIVDFEGNAPYPKLDGIMVNPQQLHIGDIPNPAESN